VAIARLERALFARPDTEPRWRGALRTAAQLTWLLGRDLNEGRLTLHAMSMVYSTLIAMVPLLAFAVSALKGLGVNGVLGPALDRVLEPLGPSGHDVATRLVDFVSNVRTGVLGALGVVLLAITALSLLRKIEAGLNEAWQVTAPRPVVARSLEYLGLLIVGPVFLFVAFTLTTTLTHPSVAHYLGPVAPWLGKLIPYVLVVAAFTLINVITPNTAVSGRSALAAGVFGGIAWQTVGLIFAVLATRSTRLSAIYSSFAILVLFLMWVYVSWLILLLGARLGFYVQNPAWRQPRIERSPLDPAEAEAAALEVMLLAARRFEGGGRPLGLAECTGRLGIQALRLDPVLRRLGEAELLHSVGARGYVLGRDPAHVSIADIIGAARGPQAPRERLPRLGTLLGKAESLRHDALTGTTLAELAGGASEEARPPE